MSRPERRFQETRGEEVPPRRYEPVQPREPLPATGPNFAGGIAAGLIAGVVMALVAMFRSLSLDAGFWFPMKQIAAFFFGVDALIGGGGVIFVGVVIHLTLSAIFGVIFGALGGAQTSSGLAFLWGLLFGVSFGESIPGAYCQRLIRS